MQGEILFFQELRAKRAWRRGAGFLIFTKRPPLLTTLLLLPEGLTRALGRTSDLQESGSFQNERLFSAHQ
jgi:hypothetical protein